AAAALDAALVAVDDALPDSVLVEVCSLCVQATPITTQRSAMRVKRFMVLPLDHGLLLLLLRTPH
ncbi:MAG TPA: hypothetical protein VGQ96_07025, partial [Candidatus Eremiobacteraceae bacterium]|nr:hypothetical protein [Candidatus Eremiobacteraceae bacterium]